MCDHGCQIFTTLDNQPPRRFEDESNQKQELTLETILVHNEIMIVLVSIPPCPKVFRKYCVKNKCPNNTELILVSDCFHLQNFSGADCMGVQKTNVQIIKRKYICILLCKPLVINVSTFFNRGHTYAT
jgi:hypothetical protein